jgi:hypothetical protein
MKTTPAPVRRLRIPELVQQVRTELVEAAQRHQNSGNATLLYVEKVTLEINVAITAEEAMDGSTEAGIWVVDFKLGGTKSLRTENTHKVTVEMVARAPGAPKALTEKLLPVASAPERPATDPVAAKRPANR